MATKPVSGSGNAAAIWNFLASKGLSAAAIAGIMGNWQQESSLSPTAVNPSSGAYGLAQWLGDRYTNLQSYCQSHGLDWTSLTGQLTFAWYEMTGGDAAWTSALAKIGGMSAFNAMSVTAATEFFEEYYEVAGSGAMMDQRVTYAQQWYNSYVNGNPFNFSSVSVSSSSASSYPSASTQSTISNQVSFPATNYSVVANSQRTGDILYGRRYRVIVSNSSGIALDVSDLHCTFDIQYVVNQQPPFSQIVIYNLNPATENFLLNYGDRVVVEAGYDGSQYGVIFDGEVVEPIRDKADNVTYRLTINALSGNSMLTQSFSNFTVARGQSARSLLENLASQATVPTPLGDISPQLSTATLPRGKSVFGMTRDYIRQIAQGNNMTFSAHNGAINLIHAADPPKGEILDLTPSSGLVGQPTQSDLGVSFQCLLNPAISINTLVHIDNSLIQAQTYDIGSKPLPLDSAGIYRVVGVEHVGDTRGNDWYTNCTTVSQAGGIPGMISTTTANPWT
ncbi:phage protein [Alicyclobacillus acidoterrestris]|uniref:phage protein n=1 Tax=Alicyclobacillus acidoterrestris TaxID=1450 RepID=UPI003F5357C8